MALLTILLPSTMLSPLATVAVKAVIHLLLRQLWFTFHPARTVLAPH